MKGVSLPLLVSWTLAAPGAPPAKVWQPAAPPGIAGVGFVAPRSFAPLVRAVRGCVVNLSSPTEEGRQSLGSGFFVSATGLLLTNHHVVARAQELRVTTASGQRLAAHVVGQDAAADVALLQAVLPPGESVPAAALGNSEGVEVGDWVLAIGNPFGLESSVTVGVVSAKERTLGLSDWDDFLQTSALINAGNSGGPLFNMRGEVVGITTSVVRRAQGIGFAIPSNLLRALIPTLLEHGQVVRGWLGGRAEQVDGSGVRLVAMAAGGPASQAGLRVGDELLALDGERVTSYQGLSRKLALLGPGRAVQLSVRREGRVLLRKLTLGRMPPDVMP